MASIDSVYRFTDLPDDALVARTRAIVGQSNQALAALLAHLGEVEARGLHRQRACASLYTYCVYELRMSEDAAFRRARAARIAREFPAVLDRVAAGEIHLTGLLMLGSHLTEENHVDVLERAKHRTKKEIAKLVREIDPLPDVPARVEPLGRTFTMPRAPSWSQFVASFASVRELDPGNRPRDWMDASPPEPEATPEPEPAPQPKLAPQPELAPQPNPMFARDDVPQRYSVQFTATEEYVELLERAKDLLSHTGEDKSLERVHVRALQSLVAELEKRRYGTGAKPRAPRADDVESTKHAGVPRQRGSSSAHPRGRAPRRACARRRPLHVRRRVGTTLPGDASARAAPRAAVRAQRAVDGRERDAALQEPQRARRRGRLRPRLHGREEAASRRRGHDARGQRLDRRPFPSRFRRRCVALRATLAMISGLSQRMGS